ncbi:hypothetical protein NDN08_003056 [Rhodosorus marinus]|uniref:Uncharacterized protein n=3 Tax=Rhodosorus marinus TaxID=101924 RepID=A0AAV8UZI3_9RHOD|nr:hypothetical protein NDN08_003056 [Rhodosorus marinus]
MGIFSKKKDMEPPPPPPPPPPTTKELARQYKREIDRSIRELDRERAKMEQQERQIQAQIKKAARDGEMENARMLAKDLVRSRNMRTKINRMKTQMQGVSMQLTTMTTSQNMANIMGGVVKAMGVMNKQMDLPSMQKVIMEYEKQSGMMDMTQEMMDDALDDMGMEDEEESQEVIDKVLDELNIERSVEIGSSVPATQAQAGAAPVQEDDLMERLENLKK